MRLSIKSIKPIHMAIGAGIIVVAIILYKKRTSLGLATDINPTDPFSSENICPPNRIVTSLAGTSFCCPYDPGPNGQCEP